MIYFDLYILCSTGAEPDYHNDYETNDRDQKP